MLDNLKQCFGLPTHHVVPQSNRPDDQASSWIPIESGANDQLRDIKPNCIFCDVRAEKGFSVIESNHEMTAFRDRNPGARHHILIIPRTHILPSPKKGASPMPPASSRRIATVKDLQPEDAPLLARMEAMGIRLLSEHGYPPEKQKLGYHIPPFSSVHHLHLHALSLPLKSWWRQLKYRSTTPRATTHLPHAQEGRKRWGWFVSSQDAIAILRSGRTIGIGSS